MLTDQDLDLPPARRRVALYSHDTQGLGHIRRNINIAAALVDDDPSVDVLLLTVTPEATMLPLPSSTEVLTLPTLHKDSSGRYSARVLTAPLDELLELRTTLIDAALLCFAPDLFIVDKVARGVGGELDQPLAALRATGRTRTVLGLRDVLDDGPATRLDWRREGTTAAIRDLYDAVWIYGDPTVYDAVREYSFLKVVADKVTYTGYLAGPQLGQLRSRFGGPCLLPAPDQKYVLCTVGGGQDGVQLARAFLAATLPPGHHGVVITGPFMSEADRRQLQEAADDRVDATVHEFVSQAHEFIRRASAAVSMAGYNTVCELMAAGCPTLLVPRVIPRTEQSVRAERLQQTGIVDMVPAAAVTPDHIGAWLATAVHAGPVSDAAIDLAGLDRIPALAAKIAALAPRETGAAHACA
ncbi:MAG: glycosyltransferase [Geodermatophilaceae bacterium]|nr:glycosyltransferase [Geodermatophilaceae bacterium]